MGVKVKVSPLADELWQIGLMAIIYIHVSCNLKVNSKFWHFAMKYTANVVGVCLFFGLWWKGPSFPILSKLLDWLHFLCLYSCYVVFYVVDLFFQIYNCVINDSYFSSQDHANNISILVIEVRLSLVTWSEWMFMFFTCIMCRMQWAIWRKVQLAQ